MGLSPQARDFGSLSLILNGLLPIPQNRRAGQNCLQTIVKQRLMLNVGLFFRIPRAGFGRPAQL
jgi:hypothetical protein